MLKPYCQLFEANYPSLDSTGTLSLTNGGPAGAVWVFLGTCVGMGTVVVSMAEMASMYVEWNSQFWATIPPPTWHFLLMLHPESQPQAANTTGCLYLRL